MWACALLQEGRGQGFVGCGRGTGEPRDSTLGLLAPGPDGPIATERFEQDEALFRLAGEVAAGVQGR